MISALAAVMQIAAPTPEWAWAEVYVEDTRGGAQRTEIFPQVEVLGDRRVLKGVVARRTDLFAGKPTGIRWTDTKKCPRLRETLDAVVNVKPLAESSLAQSYEGPAAPPPPGHRDVARVTVGSMTMTVASDAPLGKWVQSIYGVTASCWSDSR
jgi:hypothetical protein